VYHKFIGIDIGKYDFYVAIYDNNKATKYCNSSAGFSKMYTDLSTELEQALVVLETTGGYETKLIDYFLSQGISVHRADTRKVKHFIRSTGRLGKSDTIDAIGLARYGKERHAELNLYQQIDTNAKNLLEITHRRSELKQMMVQEKNRLKAPNNISLKNSCQSHIDFLNTEILRIEKVQKELVALNKELSIKIELLKNEIDGIGERTAINLLSTLPELGSLNRRQIASLAGVAPHPYESGKKIGYRNTRGGREIVKPILFMAAMAASRSKGKLGEYYRALLARGKKPMVAMTALMRKIIVIANAKIKALLATKMVGALCC
jgi:transposase